MVVLSLLVMLLHSPLDIVATVGDQKIFVADFLQRYKNFLESTGVKDNLVARTNILQMMVYERAIVHDAQQRGLLFRSSYRTEVEKIKIQTLLASYYDVFADTMTVTEEELRQTFLRFNTMVRARHLYAPTLQQARNLRERLLRGESFHTLAMEVFTDPRLKYTGGDLGYFRGGDMEPAFEDVAFSLPLGVISEPVKTEDGYSILKIEQRTVRPLLTEQEFAEKKSKVEIMVKIRKRAEMAAAIARATRDQLQVDFHKNTVKKLFSVWNKSDAIDELIRREELTSLMSLPLASSKTSQWKVKDLLQRSFKITQRHFRRVRSVEDLQELVTGLLVQEELLRQAHFKKCTETVSYKNRVANDTIVALIQTWANDVYFRTLGIEKDEDKPRDPLHQRQLEDAMKKEYESHPSAYRIPEKRNVAEIVVDSFSQAMNIIEKLSQGVSFTSLAKQFSQSPSAPLGGELGFGTRSEYGILADSIFTKAKGDVIGPVLVDGKYILLKILDIDFAKQQNYEEAQQALRQQVIRQWKERVHREAVDSILASVTYFLNKDILSTISL